MLICVIHFLKIMLDYGAMVRFAPKIIATHEELSPYLLVRVRRLIPIALEHATLSPGHCVCRGEWLRHVR